MDDDSRKATRLVLDLALAVLSLVPGIAALVLLFTAETGRGRLFAVAALCLLSLPPLVVRVLLRPRRARKPLAALATAFALLLVLLCVRSPDGRPLPGSPLRSEFLGQARYRRFAVAALLPEIDQIKLGTYLIPAIDPIIDHAAARHIRDVTMRHYRPMEAEPEFAALGTVMPGAFADTDDAHLFAYAPAEAPRDRRPTILFLHGSGGNFKSYFYLWRRFADRVGANVVLPSFGFGNWYEEGGTAAVERARAWAVSTLGADPDRIYLVGLSNGGTGVTRAAAASPHAYRGPAFLSGVLEAGVLLGGAKPGATVSLPPILVIHGRDDDRIPISYIEPAVAKLRAHGAVVDEQIVDGQDHFLLFDRDEDVLSRVRDSVLSLQGS
jgi:predicted esterase